VTPGNKRKHLTNKRERFNRIYQNRPNYTSNSYRNRPYCRRHSSDARTQLRWRVQQDIVMSSFCVLIRRVLQLKTIKQTV